MENFNVCPYCGSENWEWINDDDDINTYHCHECDSFFDEETVVREEIRHKISAILMDTDEDNQMTCYIQIEPEDTRGLSSLLWPTIDCCFQEPCEGRIWFHFEGEDDFVTGEKNYKNFDDLDTKDLEHILNELSD